MEGLTILPKASKSPESKFHVRFSNLSIMEFRDLHIKQKKKKKSYLRTNKNR